MNITFNQSGQSDVNYIYRHIDNPVFTDANERLSQISTVNNTQLHECYDDTLGHVRFMSVKSLPKDLTDWMNMGIILSQNAKQAKYYNISIHLRQTSAKSCAYFAFGLTQGIYEFNKYKSLPKIRQINVTIICDNPIAAKDLFIPLSHLSESQDLAKSLVNEPSNVLTPSAFAKTIYDTLTPLGCIVEIFDETKCTELGMDALLGVGKGSSNESFFVTIQWQGGEKDEQPIAFAGKGVTFDTGGISLKPSLNMQDMKYDMAGAATVTGLMHACSKNKLPLNVIAGGGLVENMPDGAAQNPGDIVKSMSGQTIEIHNTDAEGRLVLCDVLYYICHKHKPKYIIDLATLTGAVIVALGSSYGGLFSNNKTLCDQLLAAGQTSGEAVWHLPLNSDYSDDLKSSIADIKNIGYNGAGSCVAAQFLSMFVGEVPWAHLDIAGVAWYKKNRQSLPIGPSAFGVALLFHWLESQIENA